MLVDTFRKAQKLIASGKLDKAAALCKKSIKQDPNQLDVLHLLGIIALNKKQFDEAIKYFGKVLKTRPDHAVSHYNLGLAYRGSREKVLAVKHLKKATELQPDMAAAYTDLCAALIDIKEAEQAVAIGHMATNLTPQDPAANFNLGEALHEWRNFEDSFKYYQTANKQAPDDPTILFKLGNAYQGRGDSEKAMVCFRRIIELYPKEITAQCQLMGLNKYQDPNHEDIRHIKSLENKTGLSDDERTAIYFTLSKAYQNCNLLDDAFNYAQKGNQLQDKLRQFNPDEFADQISALINFYTPAKISELSKLGNLTNTPIFIVGTPRSGTTLTEQILCCHQDIFGAGELNWVSRCINALPGYLESSSNYPACVSDLTEKAVAELAPKYLSYLDSLASGEPRITDKMPDNFRHLGFIHTLFPNAKIIHCQREPRDASISMFLHHFPDGISYSCDLYKLGAYYSQYLRLMDHWRSVLPKGTMIEVKYESMVQNQETETRRLLAFLDLEWDETCLAFHKKKRRVFTASHDQVTKPLYSSSVERWKTYQKHLQPLEDGFNYQAGDCQQP